MYEFFPSKLSSVSSFMLCLDWWNHKINFEMIALINRIDEIEITFPTLIIHLLLIGQSMVWCLIGKIHSGFVFYASGRNSQQKYFILPEALEILRKSPFKRNEFYKLEYVLRHISIAYIAIHQLKLIFFTRSRWDQWKL